MKYINNFFNKIIIYFKDEKLNKMDIDSLRDELKSAQAEKQHNERTTMFYTALLLSTLGLMAKYFDLDIIILSIIIILFMIMMACVNIYLSKKFNNYKTTIMKIINIKVKA